MIEPARISPSAWWYAASAIPLAAGIAIGIILIVSVVKDVAGDLHRFTTPAALNITLDDGDKRDIYVQTRGAPASSGVAVPASALSCSVSGPKGPVALDVSDNTTLTTGGESFRGRYTFQANADGVYRVGCSAETRPPFPVPLAVGPHLGVFAIVGSVAGIIASFVLGILLAVLVAGLVALLRHRSKVRR